MTAKASKSKAERGYTKTDLEDVSDTPEFTANEMARAKPFAVDPRRSGRIRDALLLAQNRAQQGHPADKTSHGRTRPLAASGALGSAQLRVIVHRSKL